MEWLKELLGEEFYNKVIALLGDKKLMLDDGNNIPKSRFDEVNQAKNDLKTQVDSLNAELTKLGKLVKDNEGATAKITELQTKIAEQEAEAQNITKKFALREHLTKAGAKFPDLLEGKFDLSKIELENGSIKGFDDLVKPYKETYKDLFGENKITGKTPPAPPATPPNPEQKLSTEDWVSEMFNPQK